jgi:RecA/RadA recombinase
MPTDTKKFMAKLNKLNGAVTEKYNPYANIIDTPSPSVNFIFGNTWGIPRGYTAAFFGPPKSGKTLLAHAIMGKVHQDDPTAFVMKFDAEMRGEAQLTEPQAKLWGIDLDRYVLIQGNTPDIVFDQFEKEVAALCDEGMNLPLVVIDSVSSITGRRAMNAESVMNQQIGDHALTIQDGLKRILMAQRKHKVAVILINQARAEMDVHEIQRGHKYKMQGSFGLQHYCEYFVNFEQMKTKEGRQDLMGNDLTNEDLTDASGRADQIGQKFRVAMRDSSLGPKGRTGIFTLDYHRGFVNVHEEVFLLAVGRGVIERPNNLTYVFRDKKWSGKAAMVEALREDTDLRKEIICELKTRDIAGMLGADLTGTTQVVTEESP